MEKETVLKLLALEYAYNQGLHVEKKDMIDKLKLSEGELDNILTSLESEELVKLYKDGKGKIRLAKITWKGINKVGGVKLKYDKRGSGNG